MRRLGRLLVVVCALGAAAGCGDDDDDVTADAAVDGGNPLVARGRYLVNNVGVCTFCHTPLNPDGTRDLTKLLAGWDCFFDLDPATANVGCLSSRNLTNHATGLMNATDAQIKDAIKNGKRTDGKNLNSVMPFWVFHNMTEDDLNSVVAYLRTVPGVDHTVQANEPPWADPPGPTATAIDPTTVPMPSAGYPNQAAAMRGRYLAGLGGLCIDCHTPMLPPGPPPPVRPIDMTKPFQGGRTFAALELGLLPNTMGGPYPPMINTRNLTPDATGLMGYTVADIKKVLKEGIDKDGMGVCAATHGGATSPYAALTDGDLDDIAHYIASLPPVANDTGTNCTGPVP